MQKALAIRETVVITSNNASYLTTPVRKTRSKRLTLILGIFHVAWIDSPAATGG